MKIKEIICPICRKSLLYLKYEDIPGVTKKLPTTWVCSSNCVIAHDFSWFDRFTQFEFLVLRKDAGKKKFNKWLSHLKVENKFKKKIIDQNCRNLN